MPQITGLGGALVDCFADVSEEQLHALGSPKASMALIDADEAAALEAALDFHTRRAGGAAANTVAGMAGLGFEAAFIGKTGDDETGRFFRDDMRRVKVAFPTPPLAAHPTGRCLVAITPDAERTMHTLLGASGTIEADDLDMDLLRRTDLFFAEGYIWDNAPARAAFMQAVEAVHGRGGEVGFTLGDALCVARHRADFRALLDGLVDVLLANLAEAAALFGTDDMNELVAAVQAVGVDAVITRSENGAVIIAGGEVVEVAAEPVGRLVDLTGAGDQFAAGYLAGRVRKATAAEAGRMGALAAAEVIAHVGPRPQSDVQAVLAANGFVF